MKAIEENKIKFREDLDDRVHELTLMCLKRKPEKRPSTKEIL